MSSFGENLRRVAKLCGADRGAFVAVDPGVHGAAVVVPRGWGTRMAVALSGGQAAVDELRDWAVTHEAYTVVIEAQFVNPRNPPSTLRLAASAGGVVGALTVVRDRECKTVWVSPSTWQSALLAGCGRKRSELEAGAALRARATIQDELACGNRMALPRLAIDRAGVNSALCIAEWWEGVCGPGRL